MKSICWLNTNMLIKHFIAETIVKAEYRLQHSAIWIHRNIQLKLLSIKILPFKFLPFLRLGRLWCMTSEQWYRKGRNYSKASKFGENFFFFFVLLVGRRGRVQIYFRSAIRVGEWLEINDISLFNNCFALHWQINPPVATFFRPQY